MKFRILDLFCGAGGFAYGMDKNKDFLTVLGTDFDENAINTFKNNFKYAYTILGDIKNNDVKKKIVQKSKELGVNMIIGGPPCQGFSLKGKQLGLNDPRNFLFLEFLKIVQEIRPEVFVIENVKNLIKSSNGFFIDQIRIKFKELGYIVNDGYINAKDFGVPQNRERTIIIGSLTKNIPLPCKKNKKITTVKDAISDLSYLNSGEGIFETDYINPFKSKYQKILRGKKLYNHTATSHSEYALQKLKMIPAEGDKSSIPKELHGKQKFLTTWSRLKWNEISPTIDTRFDTPSNGKNSHPYLHRSITPREAARIQSFDDDFIFLGPKTSICKQIGNAVPPFMAKAIGETIRNAYLNKNIENKNFQIYLGDANLIIEELKNKKIKVDHIITDPPYKISKKNNFQTMAKPRQGVYFGEWDSSFDLISWIKNYTDLLNKDGSIIIFCSYIHISYIINELQSNDIDVKDILVWEKTNPMPRNVKRRYVQDKEFAIWGVKKNSKWVFNKPTNIAYLKSTFKTSIVSGTEKTIHTTQKSLKLMEEIVKIHTDENQIILDPFMGSGTTGLAALNLKRKFIGIEKNPDYFSISLDRLLNKIRK